MKLPDAILAKTLARFDSLIAEGRNILGGAENVQPTYKTNKITGDTYQSSSGYKKLDPEKFIEWRTKAATLLALVIPPGHVHRDSVEEIAALQCTYDLLQNAISLLRGIKDDLEKGFLDGMAAAIEAEIACDYLGQAEQLLAEGHGGKLSHIPAAVLSGAVLEKALRTLCDQQQPPIALQTLNGEHKTLNPLID